MTVPALFAIGCFGVLALGGCACGPQCKTGFAMRIGPVAGTATSASKAPANQQGFQAGVGVVLLQQGSGSCGIPEVLALVHPAWTTSDPAHITISSADDFTNGSATCTGPTNGAATVTATLPAGSAALGTTTTPLTATAQLTCN